jgi:hypothetical protein
MLYHFLQVSQNPDLTQLLRAELVPQDPWGLWKVGVGMNDLQ